MKVKYKSYVGSTKGRLSIVQYVPGIRSKSHKRITPKFRCQCSCGKEKTTSCQSVVEGTTKSCGCLSREQASKNIHAALLKNTKHGASHTSEYTSYRNMTTRCIDSAYEGFHNYGGRGIKVCNRWLGTNGLQNFLLDMGPKPTPKHQIDRYPNRNGNYEPGNCRWATTKQQGRNRNSNRLITFNGRTMCITEWSEETGLPFHIISMRTKAGWDVEKALTTPINVNKSHKRKK